MKPRIHRVLLVLIAAFAGYLYASAQDEQNRTAIDRAMTASASCYDGTTGKLVGSQRLRTSVLVSSDGRYRAYAESEADASQGKDADSRECRNTSTLFVASQSSQKFLPILTVKPLPERLGNSIDLVDWSADGHRLLFAQGSWQWGSDVGETTVGIYDADDGKLSSQSFVEEAFSKHAGKACAGVFQPIGFSASGEVIVHANPYFDYGEDSPSKDSCVPKEGLWIVDSASLALRKLPHNYNRQHYGKTAPSASQ